MILYQLQGTGQHSARALQQMALRYSRNTLLQRYALVFAPFLVVIPSLS